MKDQVGGFLGDDLAVDPDRSEPWADADWTRAVLATAARVFGVVGPEARTDTAPGPVRV
jgi:hypothetical protein